MAVTRPHEDRLGGGTPAAGYVLSWTGTGTAAWAVGGSGAAQFSVDANLYRFLVGIGGVGAYGGNASTGPDAAAVWNVSGDDPLVQLAASAIAGAYIGNSDVTLLGRTLALDAETMTFSLGAAVAADSKHYLTGGHGLVVPILAADPSGGNSEAGQVYFNSATLKHRVYDTAWHDVGGRSLLAEFDLGADTADFDFTSIAGTYRQLQLVWWGRGTKSADFDQVRVQFNGDTGSNYESSLIDSGSNTDNVTGATSSQIGDVTAATSAAGYASGGMLTIPFYADTSFNKVFNASGYMRYGSLQFAWTGGGHWINTAAITRVRLFPLGGNWLAGSRCALYGIT